MLVRKIQTRAIRTTINPKPMTATSNRAKNKHKQRTLKPQNNTEMISYCSWPCVTDHSLVSSLVGSVFQTQLKTKTKCKNLCIAELFLCILKNKQTKCMILKGEPTWHSWDCSYCGRWWDAGWHKMLWNVVFKFQSLPVDKHYE